MSVVYFAQFQQLSAFKIGSTGGRPEWRAKSISDHLPYVLDVVADFPGDRFRERFVQCWFAPTHLRGEWYEQSEELWRWIIEAKDTGDIKLVPPEPRHGFAADSAPLSALLRAADISAQDVADVCRVYLTSVEGAFARSDIQSRLLIAGALSLVIKKGATFPGWDALQFRGIVEPRAPKKGGTVTDGPYPSICSKASSAPQAAA